METLGLILADLENALVKYCVVGCIYTCQDNIRIRFIHGFRLHDAVLAHYAAMCTYKCNLIYMVRANLFSLFLHLDLHDISTGTIKCVHPRSAELRAETEIFGYYVTNINGT